MLLVFVVDWVKNHVLMMFGVHIRISGVLEFLSHKLSSVLLFIISLMVCSAASSTDNFLFSMFLTCTC